MRELESEDLKELSASPEDDRGLARYLENRVEYGLGRMLADIAIEPRDPFKPDARRKVKKEFAVIIWTAIALIGWFAWFNLIQ